MKKFALIALFAVVIFFPTAVSFAQIVPCDGAIGIGGDANRVCQGCHLVQLGQNIITFLIEIIAFGGAVVFAIGGLRMVMSRGNTGEVEAAKSMMTNVVIGLVILLAGWLVIDTVLKTLLDDSTESEMGPWHTIECVTQPTLTTTPPTTPVTPVTPVTPTTPAAGCTGSCVALSNSITIKNGACSGASACTVSSAIASDLTSLDSKLDAAGVNWQVTEAYPPTRTHKDPCHAAGTCIDANCIGGCTASQVKTFLDSANTSGLRAVYEVKTQSEKDALVRNGVNASSVSVLGDWISAPHFSVYDGG